MKKLTPKQAAFVREYLIDLNATQAAVRAGYSKSTAAAIGHENLRKPEIEQAIQKAINERSRRTEITQDRVLQELARIAYSDPRQLYNDDGALKPIPELSDEAAASLAGFEILEVFDGKELVGYTKKVKRWDKLKALDLLCEHLGIKRGATGDQDKDPIDDIFAAMDEVEAADDG